MSNDQISNILIIAIACAFIILFFLLIALVVIKMRENKKKKNMKQTMNGSNKESISQKSIIEQNYDKQSVFNFMEFDKIEDNMIVQNNGARYLMVVECQGINYDLMSKNEKLAVEQGFIQFLNTLRHPVQLYIQTRTVNLEKSVSTYRDRLKEFEDKLNKMKLEYQRMVETGKYKEEELNKFLFEITKQANLCEYGRDIIVNTEKMSLNKRVLSKHYYVVVPYYPTDIGNDNLDREEIKNVSFSELYTMAQSVVRTLSICGINSKVLNSNELTDLLYIAYNRDEEEVYGLEKAKKAGYEELYSTATDVLDKKMKILNEKIEKEAIALANLKILEVKSEKEKAIEEAEDNLDLLVDDLAKSIIQNNKQFLGKEIAEKAIDKIDKDTENKKKVKGGEADASKKTKTRARRTKKAE